MVITASVQPESGRVVYAGSDFSHPILFCSSKEGMDYTVQNWPGSDLEGLVSFLQTHLVWKQADVQELSGPVWAKGNRPLPASSFQTRLRSSTQGPDRILQNQPGSDIVLVVRADCARFWPNRSGPEASRCARTIGPASGQRFRADLDRMGIGSGMFTRTMCK